MKDQPMKPLYANKKRLSRCPCCQTKYSKHNAKGKKHGNSAGRQIAKRELMKGF